jgi:hypothetical protein
MLTLLEAAKRANLLDRVYIEEYAKSSDILAAIGFKDIDGNAYAYSREHALPGVGFRGYNEGYPNTVGVLNPQSEAMKMAGGDLDVDMAIIATHSEDERAIREMMQIKSLAHAWTRSFIKGDSAVDAKMFDGLQTRLTGTQVIDASNTGAGAALSLDKLDEVIDLVDMPTHLIMSKAMRRKLTSAGRNTSVGGFITYQPDAFGRQLAYYQDLPILVAWQDNNDSEILPFTEVSSDGADLDTGSIYCVSFGEKMVEGLNFRNNEGGYGISVRDLGELDALPVVRTRVDWHTSIAVQNGRAAARLRGVQNKPVTA